MMLDKIHNYSIQDILQLLEHDFQESGLYVDFTQQLSDHPLQHPYRTANYTILLLQEGTMTVQLDLVTYELKQNTLVIVPPHTVIYFKSFCTDLVFITLSFDKTFAITHTQNEKSDFSLLASSKVHHLLLDDRQLPILVNLCELIDQKNKQKADFQYYIASIHHLFALLLLELKAISQHQNPIIQEHISRKEHLTLLFLEALQTHFRTEKQVRFYAATLCVSDRYLAKVIKEVTSKTIGELIDQAIVIEAQLLLTNTTLTIMEIADELHFNSTSFFGKFFKRKVGCSPGQYRKQF
ncbi:helix-turn-helix domain-containing protein [Myroides odoratus]|uniref:helix-turn-helix domain-containing protein n=1 Tax=Myroides odoratus TaxID=256 RepID=UPI000A648D55|nr:AraC family transcriptional regulator [Myroides odoratus]